MDAVPPAAERRSSAGLRYLEGSAVARQDTTPLFARLPPGRKPVITLARDGRFADEGVFAAFLHSSYSDDDPRDRAGAGTYEIRNYTLVLHDSDGRVKQVAFTALLGADPARSSDILFLRRSRFNRIP